MITYLRAETPWLEESLTIVLSRLSYITGLKHNGNESRQYLILNNYTNYIITQNVKHWTNNKHQIFLFLAWTIFFWSKKLRPWSTGRRYLAEVFRYGVKHFPINQSINQSINLTSLSPQWVMTSQSSWAGTPLQLKHWFVGEEYTTAW